METPELAPVRQVEAARYALLRRLTLAMQRHMLLHLRPISSLGAAIEQRLRAQAPDLAGVRADLHEVRGFAREAVEAHLDMVGWLAPDPAQRMALDEGVTQCVALLGGPLADTGFRLQLGAHPPGAQVVASTLRTVLPAALLALADAADGPARIVIDSKAGHPGLALLLRVEPAGPVPALAPPDDRRLAWEEVAVLAAAEGVDLDRKVSTVRLRFTDPA